MLVRLNFTEIYKLKLLSDPYKSGKTKNFSGNEEMLGLSTISNALYSH